MGPRQFTDKTVHRHVYWRQFTDKIRDSSPTDLKTVHRQKKCICIYGITGKKLVKTVISLSDML